MSVIGLASAGRVIPGSALRINPDGTGQLVPGMLPRFAVTALLTGDFWNVRHICTDLISDGETSAGGPAADRCATADSAGPRECRCRVSPRQVLIRR